MWELKPQYSACKCQYLTRLTRFAPRFYSTQFLHLCKRLYNNKPKKVYPQCKINSIYWKVSNSVCYFHLLLLFTVHVKSISIVRPNSERACFPKCQSVNSAVGIRRRTKGHWGPSGGILSKWSSRGKLPHHNILMEIFPRQVLGLGRIWRTRMFSDIWKPMFSRASRPQPPDQF